MNVIEGYLDKKVLTVAEFQNKIEDLIEELNGNLTLAEVVGVLEFIKHNVLIR